MHYYDDGTAVVDHGDCLDVLRQLPDNSVDAVVTDPPYGLSNTDPGHVTDALRAWCAGDLAYVPAVSGGGFMGKAWDSFVPPPAVWAECLRVLKPGGHALVFAGSRTVDLMGMSLRLAGFDIRDQLQWLYGSGFPKSMDVSKAIDKAAGAEREVVGPGGRSGQQRQSMAGAFAGQWDETAPATPEAEQWQGWGTALKPAHEPIILARKPFRGTVAANVLDHGTGALNIDSTRIGTNGERVAGSGNGGASIYGQVAKSGGNGGNVTPAAGRWPANVILDEDAAEVLDEQSGFSKSPPVGSVARTRGGNTIGTFDHAGRAPSPNGHGDSGGASRFFYVAKAGKAERPIVETADGDKIAHPTVKPLKLMRWLVRLITPPGGLVLDPFAGSGTTLEAALEEGFRVHGIEAFPDYLPLIRERVLRVALSDLL